jgi:hypothetical protein
MEKEHCGSNISKHNTTQMQITVRSALPSFKLLQTEGKPPEIEEHPEMELNQTDQLCPLQDRRGIQYLLGLFCLSVCGRSAFCSTFEKAAEPIGRENADHVFFTISVLSLDEAF